MGKVRACQGDGGRRGLRPRRQQPGGKAGGNDQRQERPRNPWDSALAAAGAVVDDACDAMLIMSLSRVAIAEAAQLPAQSDIALLTKP